MFALKLNLNELGLTLIWQLFTSSLATAQRKCSFWESITWMAFVVLSRLPTAA